MIKYTEEEAKNLCARAHWWGWVCRERLDGPDSQPVAYPASLDYEEKEDYAFEQWWEKNKPQS